jgi:Fe-S-cluster containining protein
LVNTPIDFEDVGGEAPGGTQLLRQSGDPVDMEWHLRDGDTLVFECNHLTDDGKCGIYEDRPDMCRRWECDALQGYTDLEGMLSKYAVNPETIDDADLENVTDRMNASLERLSHRLDA